MSRARNTTTAPTGSIAPLGLRLLPELREMIEAAARTNGRSMNAEVTARLKTSFESNAVALPASMQQAVKQEMAARGGTFEEAMVRVALTAQAQGGTLLHITLTPHTTYLQLKDLLKAGETIIPPSAAVVVETKR